MYAARSAAFRFGRDLPEHRDPDRIEPLVTYWHRWVAGTFVRSYLENLDSDELVPPSEEGRAHAS